MVVKKEAPKPKASKPTTTKPDEKKNQSMTGHEKVPFACDIAKCEYTAKTKGSITRHKNKVHVEPEADSKQFKCDVKGCKFSGGSKSVVTRHWNNVHRSPHGQKRNTRKANQDQGRPSILTPKVIAKLVIAFKSGYTKVQAFRYAGISKDVYYDAMKSDEDFADKMRRSQDHLGLKARDVVAAAINASDVKTSKWWLERKAKDEYSLRREATGAGGGAVRVETNRPKSISLEELHDAVLSDT